MAILYPMLEAIITHCHLSPRRIACSNVFGSDWFKRLKAESSPAENLREMREWLGISAAELSRRTGISPQHISGMENGTRPIGKKLAAKIATALGCSPESFV
jgi:DNA-binding XRE family transcriptional regulator